jgi:hypothetical protein
MHLYNESVTDLSSCKRSLASLSWQRISDYRNTINGCWKKYCARTASDPLEGFGWTISYELDLQIIRDVSISLNGEIPSRPSDQVYFTVSSIPLYLHTGTVVKARESQEEDIYISHGH